MYFIIIFRNGLMGLTLYSLPLFVQIYLYFYNLIIRRRKPDEFSTSLTIFAICLLVSGIPANSIYGSTYYGFFLALLFELYSPNRNLKLEKPQML